MNESRQNTSIIAQRAQERGITEEQYIRDAWQAAESWDEAAINCGVLTNSLRQSMTKNRLRARRVVTYVIEKVV